MAGGRRLTLEDARRIGDRLGVDWDAIDPAELRRGIEVEIEQAGGAAVDTTADATGDDLLSAGRVAWLRLREVPDFYTRLDELAAAAEKHRVRRFRF
jgi:hypothetical protein